MSVPGLKVLAPATPADAYGLLKSAFRETGPVLFVDHKRLFPTAGEVPAGEEAVPIGSAVIRRRGVDVTIATFSYMTRIAATSAERLAVEGISCEIVDLRSLAPLDMTTICESAARTRRVAYPRRRADYLRRRRRNNISRERGRHRGPHGTGRCLACSGVLKPRP